MKILVVDDSKAVHAFVASIFGNSPVGLQRCYDGQEAVDFFSNNSNHEIDLILLDWEMPRLDGISTLKSLRASGLETPIMMVTTKNNPKDIGAAIENGANEYVMKPYTHEILIDKIKMIFPDFELEKKREVA